MDEPVAFASSAAASPRSRAAGPRDLLRELVDEAGEGADVIAELGIGLYPGLEPRGHVMLDEKAAGTAHVAIGRNTGLYGGVNEATIHVDCVFAAPEIEVDGRRIDAPGRVAARRPAGRTATLSSWRTARRTSRRSTTSPTTPRVASRPTVPSGRSAGCATSRRKLWAPFLAVGLILWKFKALALRRLQAQDLRDLGDDARLGRGLRAPLGLALRGRVRAAPLRPRARARASSCGARAFRRRRRSSSRSSAPSSG